LKFGTTKEQESDRQNWLKTHKPKAYEKIIKYPERVKNGESIAIIQFQYDYACNFRCEHCCISKFQRPRKVERASGQQFFDLPGVKKLADEAHDMGLGNFVITGGEPLAFGDLDGLIAAIDPSRFFLAIDTNGWLLDLPMAKRLKKLGVDKVQLSLDGLDAFDHDAFRRKDGSWAACMTAINACQLADLHVILSTVMWKDRVHSQEFIDYLEWAKEAEIGTYVTFAKPVGAYEGNFDAVLDEEDEAHIATLSEKYDVFTHMTPSYGLDLGCIAVKRMVSITRYGDVMPCPYTHVSLGNVFKEPLRDIIERGLNNRWFAYGKKYGCLAGVKGEFIDNVITKTYGKELPVPYDEIFTAEDEVDG
jgi:MoaA/NifB/PqqE/SkfB family radical SAM enzyme